MKSETKLLQRFTGVEAALGKAQSTVTLDVVCTTYVRTALLSEVK